MNIPPPMLNFKRNVRLGEAIVLYYPGHALRHKHRMTPPIWNTESDSVLGRFCRFLSVFLPLFPALLGKPNRKRKPFMISAMRDLVLSDYLIVYRFSSVFIGFLERESCRILDSILRTAARPRGRTHPAVQSWHNRMGAAQFLARFLKEVAKTELRPEHTRRLFCTVNLTKLLA